MVRLLVLSLALTLGCAGFTTGSTVSDDVAAGAIEINECHQIAEQIERCRDRMLNGGFLSPSRVTDERRLRALQARSETMGCEAQHAETNTF